MSYAAPIPLEASVIQQLKEEHLNNHRFSSYLLALLLVYLEPGGVHVICFTAVGKDWVYPFAWGLQCLLGLNDFSNMKDQLPMYWNESAKQFYLENLFDYSFRIWESVQLCLVKMSQILIDCTTCFPHISRVLGVKKSVHSMHLSTVCKAGHTGRAHFWL